ncbi:hypothetical protein GCM10008924_04630 [Gracilibacillus halotolerans]
MLFCGKKTPRQALLKLVGGEQALSLFLLSSSCTYPLEVLSNAILWQKTPRQALLKLVGGEQVLSLFLG